MRLLEKLRERLHIYKIQKNPYISPAVALVIEAYVKAHAPEIVFNGNGGLTRDEFEEFTEKYVKDCLNENN